jgi:hypothetical protein
MNLRAFASQSFAALFVATLALGSAPARADELPVPRVYRHHYHHRYVQPVVRHVYVERPIYASTCGCGGAVGVPVFQAPYHGYQYGYQGFTGWYHPWVRTGFRRYFW